MRQPYAVLAMLGPYVRDLVLMYALGDIPDEARPYGYGGRLTWQV